MNLGVPSTLIVDGEFFLHRVMHLPAFIEMKNSQGMSTGGVFGVLQTIYGTMLKFPGIRKCIVVWDSGHSQRRKEILPEYKGNRAPKVGKEAEYEAFRNLFESQKLAARESLPLFGTRPAILPCKEGDDIIGWFARSCTEDIVIASEDRDLLQLVRPNVSVYHPIKDKFICHQNFRQEVGVPRHLFLLRKALLGDTSDNIPGIPQVAETTVDRVMRVVVDMLAADPTRTARGLLQEACCTQISVDPRNRRRYTSIIENFDTIRQNLILMDISKEPFTAEDAAHLTWVLDSASGVFQEVKALTFLTVMEFNLFKDDWGTFSGPFRRLR